MKKIFFYLLISFGMITSCNKTAEKPKDLLSKNDMAEILSEMYLYKQNTTGAFQKESDLFDTQVSIFKKHKTTKEIFQSSYDYYYVQTQDMNDIYDDAIDMLLDSLNKDQKKTLKNELQLRRQNQKGLK